jgi:hypothetical protein
VQSKKPLVHCVSVFLQRGKENIDPGTHTSILTLNDALFVVLPPQGTQVTSGQAIQGSTAQDPQGSQAQDIQESQETQAQGRLHSRSTPDGQALATTTKRPAQRRFLSSGPNVQMTARTFSRPTTSVWSGCMIGRRRAGALMQQKTSRQRMPSWKILLRSSKETVRRLTSPAGGQPCSLQLCSGMYSAVTAIVHNTVYYSVCCCSCCCCQPQVASTLIDGAQNCHCWTVLQQPCCSLPCYKSFLG